MKSLIDFALFQYKCIEINQGDEIFTYKTDENTAKKISQELFEFFNKISNSENILKDLFNKKNDHEVKQSEKRNLILKIFEKFGFKDAYIDQYIGSNSIYQIKTKGERRLFILIETKELINKDKILIIKPLFLDVNHVIYNNKQFQKNFQRCSVCLEHKCNILHNKTNKKVSELSTH